MNNKLKRVAAIHDISCMGKCSLTVALPVISAAGIEVSVIPTAVLSTHTGGFDGFTYRDLTDDILPVADHWKTLGVKFDAFYTGFLGSFTQIEMVSKIFDMLKSDDTFIVVDPVMADNGKLYSVFDENFPAEMKKLCSKADLIVPNITEAVFMLEEPYTEGPYTEEYISQILKKLSALGPEKVVLTGVCFDDKKIGAASYDRNTDTVAYALEDSIDGYYHGTGDVFASALVSGVMNGLSIASASEVAAKFTVKSIIRTRDAKTDIRFGVNFEAGLCSLYEEIQSKLKK